MPSLTLNIESPGIWLGFGNSLEKFLLRWCNVVIPEILTWCSLFNRSFCPNFSGKGILNFWVNAQTLAWWKSGPLLLFPSKHSSLTKRNENLRWLRNYRLRINKMRKCYSVIPELESYGLYPNRDPEAAPLLHQPLTRLHENDWKSKWIHFNMYDYVWVC